MTSCDPFGFFICLHTRLLLSFHQFKRNGLDGMDGIAWYQMVLCGIGWYCRPGQWTPRAANCILQWTTAELGC